MRDTVLVRDTVFRCRCPVPIAQVAADLGMSPETLRRGVRRAEADSGGRPGLPSTPEREEIKALRREVFELRRANEILKSASAYFEGARPDRPS